VVSGIKEDADYEGVRVQFHATPARARIPMQLDIGFGDVITPAPTEIEYPTLLNFHAPVLRAYPRETVVAEKPPTAAIWKIHEKDWDSRTDGV
jgi:hypothetical protein